MAAIASLFLVLVLSVLVTRVASVALTLTGVSEDLARFQARSAFTGVGFTTGESERIVGHPVRRRIVMGLMVLGNAGIVSALASILLTLIRSGGTGETLLRAAVLVVGAGAVWAVASSRLVDRQLSRIIRWALRRWTRLEVFDYLSLLGLEEEYGIRQFEVQENDWLAGKTLAESQLREEGVLALAVQRERGGRIGVPRRDTPIRAGDTLILYGEQNRLDELRHREQSAAGDSAHGEAIEEQRDRAAEQKRHDEAADADAAAGDERGSAAFAPPAAPPAHHPCPRHRPPPPAGWRSPRPTPPPRRPLGPARRGGCVFRIAVRRPGCGGTSRW